MLYSITNVYITVDILLLLFRIVTETNQSSTLSCAAVYTDERWSTQWIHVYSVALEIQTHHWIRKENPIGTDFESVTCIQ